jgi:hypothetical protein
MTAPVISLMLPVNVLCARPFGVSTVKHTSDVKTIRKTETLIGFLPLTSPR